jgi:peptide/nickel transport system substrate-binding protein
MLSLRYLLKLTGAFVKRFKLVLFAGILLGIGLFVIVNVIKPAFLFSSTQRIGLTGRWGVDSLPQNILRLISEGLTITNSDGSVSPGLAASWSTTDNGSTWVFYLDPQKIWQDGKKVTSDSIKYSFSDAKVEKPDDKTLVFKLNSPFAPFPTVVSKPTFKKGLLGVGDWKVTKITMNGNYVSNLTLKDKNGNRKIFRFYPTEEKTKTAFKLGKVDKIQEILNPEPLDTWNRVVLSQNIDENSFVGIFFNTEDKVVGEKSVRQALNYALDKEKLGERAISPVSPSSWAYNPQVKPYNFDPQRAKELIADLPDEIKGELNLKLTTIPSLLSVAEKIAASWETVGVKTQVNVSPSIPTEYQIFVIIFQIPQDPDQYFLWHSTQETSNLSNYKNPRIDKLLEDGRQVTVQEERKKIYLDFQRYLVEDSPAIFLYHPAYYTISKK